MVEFALILPVFMLFLLIAVDFGRLFFTNIQLSNAVREAASYGAMHPDAASKPAMLARANLERNSQSQAGQQDVLTLANLETRCATPADVTIACEQAPGAGGAGNTLTVTLTAPFNFFTPFINNFFGNNLNISTSATVAVLNSAAGPGSGNPSSCAAPTVATFTVFINGLTVTLDPTGSLPEAGLCAISGYNYDLGDGNFAAGGTVPTTYTYAGPGIYTIELEVTNQGGSKTTTRTVTVPVGASPSASAAPSASASAAPSAPACTAPVANFQGVQGNPNKKYTFTDLSSTPAGCPITNWLWNFGDGSPLSNALNPIHTFPNNNAVYSVTLTVTNSAGSSSITKVVNT